MKKNFSTPKIYNANSDLNKRWYVYFSFRNPDTEKLERMKNIYGKSNNFKTKEDRLSVLTDYRKKLLQLLKAGFNQIIIKIYLLSLFSCQNNFTPDICSKVFSPRVL